MTLLEAALRYAQQGWAVHPLVPHSKAPLSAHGCKDATTDADQIRAWWAEHPGANIGIATGAISGIVVLDVDVKNGKPGNQTLAALVAQHGELPTTPHQTTWSGGLQYFFEYDARVKNTAGALGAGLDTRGDGGYVVAPPSRVEEAGRSGVYVWDDLMNPFALPLYAKIPEWLIPSNWERVNGKTRETIPQLAGKGRNNALTSLAGTMRRRDVSEDAVRQALLAENATFSKPLGVEEVEKIVQSAMRNFGAADDITQDAGGERFTDMANAARLADEAAGRIAHADEMKGQRWFVHDGTRLVDEPKTAVIPFVRDVAQRLFAEATALQDEIARRETAVRADAGNLTANAGNAADQAIEELERRAEMKVQGAKRLESRDGCYSAIELAQAEPSLRIKMHDLDAHPTWLNTPTGTLDLLTGEVHEHRFEDYITKITGVGYVPGATCRRWEAFLAEVLPDVEVRAFMQRSVGYALTDLMSEQCLWFLHGTGRNGKTTFLNIIRRVLGDYAASTQATTLMVKKYGDDKRNDIAVLRGARFVSATEAEQGQQIAEALIKQITGQDPVTARLMYAEFFTFTPTFKVMLAANHKPQIKGQDLGIWRRIHLVPFTVTIPEEKADQRLPEALAAEASGILNWALTGFKEWQRGGLRPPEAVRAATDAYRAESDPLGEFFEECIVINSAARVGSADLFQAYQRWAVRAGVKFTLTQKMLGQALEERGYRPGKAHGGVREWRGLGLR